MCRIKRLSVLAHVRVSCTPAWICKWNFVWSRWSARPSAAAEPGYEYQFFCIHRPSLPVTPHLTQRRISFLFVSAFIRSAARPLRPASPPSRAFTDSACGGGGGGTCAEAVQTQKMMFFVAVVAGITAQPEQRDLTKASWEHLYEPRSEHEAERHRSELLIRCHLPFFSFFFFKPNEWSRALCSIGLIAGALLTGWVIVTLNSCVCFSRFNTEHIHTRSVSFAPRWYARSLQSKEFFYSRRLYGSGVSLSVTVCILWWTCPGRRGVCW